MNMLYIMTAGGVNTAIYVSVKTHQRAHLKLANLTACKLYFSNAIFKKGEEKKKRKRREKVSWLRTKSGLRGLIPTHIPLLAEPC